MSAANRRRGHNCERNVAKYLRANGFPEAKTTRQILGHDGATAPGDVTFHPLICLEVKDVASSAWPTWCRQAAAEAPAGTVPVVVRRERGVTDVGQWPCRVQWLDVRETMGIPNPFYVLGMPDDDLGDLAVVDGEPWMTVRFAEFVAAVAALDAPGAVA